MRRGLLLLIFGLLALSAGAQTITADNYGGYNRQVLAGSVRRVYVTLSGDTGNLVNWSIGGTTGGATATLSGGTNAQPWVDMTVGPTSGSCSISPSSGSGTGVTYTLSSTATIDVHAVISDATSQSVDVIYDVCAKTSTVYIAPFYIVLYSGQKEDFQSWVIGNTNQNVTWAATRAGGGGDATLSDTTNRDVVFSATVAGEYTLTATSVDDNTKNQFATIYVTGNAMPYTATPNGTLPVDCTVDPNMTGTVYQVGPARAYTTINAALTAIHNSGSYAGDTVVVHNDDTTGSSPTTYHEYVQIEGLNDTRTQPFRLVGCPDSHGNLPIIDANDSTGATWESVYAAVDYGAVNIHIANGGPPYVIVEGFNVKDAYSDYSYYPMTALLSGAYTTGGIINGTAGQTCTIAISGYPTNAAATITLTGTNTIASGTALTVTAQGNGLASPTTTGNLGNGTANCSGTATITTTVGTGSLIPWQGAAECINDRDGPFHVLRGNEISNCGTGVFTEFNGNNTGWAAYKISVDTEGNYIHGNGALGTAHQLYLQGWLELVQFNHIGAGRTTGSAYDQLKSRGLSPVIRYNEIDDSGLAGGRHIDLDDDEDSSNWVFPYVGSTSYGYVSEWANGDTKGLDWATGWWEAWHSAYIYGNVLIDSSDAQYLIHFMGDHGFVYQDREGFLYLYDNTGVFYSDVFDMDDNSASTAPPEYPEVLSQNNVFWNTSAGGCWNRNASAVLSWTTDQVNAALANFTTPIPTAWACNDPHTYTGQNGTVPLFTGGTPVNNHFAGWDSADIISVASMPVNATTYAATTPQAGTVLSGNEANMPVRFQFGPATGFYDPRATPVTGTTAGIVGAIDGGSTPVVGAPVGLKAVGVF